MYVPFRAISVFHAAARSGSISKAASALGVTPSAVSQQIQALEVHLGAALMVKVGRGVALTEEGERFFAMIVDEIERITEATNRIRGLRTIATLTVRATPSLSSKWLLPRLAAFLDSHPELEVRLDGTNEPTDFSKENIDLEIRHGEGRWLGLHVEGFAEESFLPVCSPSYCRPESMDPGDLPQFRLIQSVKSQVQWGHWFLAAGVTPSERLRRVLFDRTHMAIDAAAAGMGIALESNLMMWRELHDGQLVCPVRSPPSTLRTTQWVVYPRDHLRHNKVRVFLEWLWSERDRWMELDRQRPNAKV
jgi:LysR family transcriptional regulator, glycine cleavage system transcriptional activator